MPKASRIITLTTEKNDAKTGTDRPASAVACGEFQVSQRMLEAVARVLDAYEANGLHPDEALSRAREVIDAMLAAR